MSSRPIAGIPASSSRRPARASKRARPRRFSRGNATPAACSPSRSVQSTRVTSGSPATTPPSFEQKLTGRGVDFHRVQDRVDLVLAFDAAVPKILRIDEQRRPAVADEGSRSP